MPKPRVLVVTTTYPAQENDGTPRFVADLAQALADRAEILVLTPRVPGAPRRERVGQVSIIRFPYAPRRLEGLADGAIVANLRHQPWRLIEVPLLSLGMWWAIRTHRRRFRPDVIHAHWLVPNGLISTFQGRGPRTPVLVTSHGVDLHAFQREPLESIRRLAIKRCDVISTVSGELAERVRMLGGGDASVVRMGADLGSLDLSDSGFQRETNRILFVGRLAEKKGVSVLLDALAKLPATHLRVVGDGPLRNELERRAVELGVDSRVVFLGQQNRSQVAAELQRASVLAIPSVTASDGDREGTPVVLGEAIAMGTPVVASNLGGLGELLSPATGWLVDEGDPDQLATALSEALGPDGANRADAAIKVVLPEVDLRSTADAYAAMIEDLTQAPT